MTPQQGSVLSQYYNSQHNPTGQPRDTQVIGPRKNYRLDNNGNVFDLDTGDFVRRQTPDEYRYSLNLKRDRGEDVTPTTSTRSNVDIPEDLSQPMVGPNSAYGPYYELGPFGPYDTRDINDSRHPDNPNNRQVPEVEPDDYERATGLPSEKEMMRLQREFELREANEARTRKAEAEEAQRSEEERQHQEASYEKQRQAEKDYYKMLNERRATAGDGGYQAPTQAEMREMAQQAQALREANDARTAAAEAELAADSGTSIQGGFDQYGNLYGSEPYHYGQGPTPDQVKPLPQVDITPYPPVAPELSIPNPQPDPYLGPRERPIPQVEPTQSAGYLRSTGEGGAGLNSYYDEINAYLANHSQDEVQQAMGTYGVSQEDVDAARAYQQPQYARGGLSRMLRKVNRKVR